MLKKPTYEELENRIRELELAASTENRVPAGLGNSTINHCAFLDTINDAVLIFDPETQRVLDVNGKMSRIYGYTRQEAIQLDLGTLSAETSTSPRPCAKTFFRRAADGGPQLFEWEAKKKNGDIFWVEISLGKTFIDRDECIIAIARDITARKKTEHELKSQTDRFKHILHGADAGTWEWDIQTGQTVFNTRWAQIIGYTHGEISPSPAGPWSQRIHPDDLDQSNAALDKHFKGECDFYSAQFRMKHKQGHWVWILSNGKVIARTREGEPLWMCGTHQDITRHMQKTKALQREQKKYKTILQTSVNGFWLTDLKGRLLEVNQAYCRMSGYSEAALLSMHIPELEGNMGPADVAAKIRQVQFRGYDRFETKHRRKDGQLYDVEIVVQYMEDDNGRLFVFSNDISQRKKSEEMIDVLSQTWKLVQKAANIGYWSHKIKGWEAIWSEQMFPILGFDPDKGVPDYETFIESLHPDDRLNFDDAFQAAKSGVPYNIEARRILPDGSMSWFNSQGFPRHGNDGTVFEVFGTLQDITERKKAEFTLQFTQYAVDKVSDEAYWITKDNGFFYVNDAACRSLGYTREELLTLSVPDINPLFTPDVFNAYWHGLEKTGFDTFETIHRSKDGREYPVEVRASYVIFNGQGYNCAFATDISGRKQIEKSLKKSENFRRTLFQAIPEPVWLKDTDGRFLACNAMFERLIGAGEEDIVRKTDYHFLEKALADKFRKRDQEVIASGKPVKSEDWIPFADNEQLALLETVKTPMFDDQGNLIGVLGVARDISERRQAEEEQFKLKSQLQQAQKMESVGRLAGGVAHDFNNMLSIIMGNAEIVVNMADIHTAPGKKIYSHSQEILKATQRSADITRQLLAFARKQPIAPKVLDLNQAVQNMLKMIQRLIGEDICLTWLPGKESSLVKMDPSQLDQILINLCVNARDAILGVGNLTIGTSMVILGEDDRVSNSEFVPGKFVMLWVCDDGRGIDKDTLDKIFEPFFTTKTIDKGTGLGLATVYGIVNQNNGVIKVDSEPTIGSTFRIYLPCHETIEKLTPKHNNGMTDVQGNETILLVEDEPGILEVTQKLLETLGYHVLNTTSPGQAIQIASEHDKRIHLLVTDVVMPGMTGLELAHELQLLDPNIKYLFMSGYPADVIARHGVLNDGIHFIPKPFSTHEFSVKVREALGTPKK